MPNLQGVTILLVDDEKAVRTFLSRILRFKGYAVEEASDGEEATELFRAHSETIGLLLTDLKMPRKNGVELVDELKTLCPKLPVVFMSGDYHEWRDKLTSYPFPCLQKPFATDMLLRVVEMNLSGEGCEIEESAGS